MAGTRDLDIKEFAQRVERLCDYLLAKIIEETGRDGSSTQKVIEDIKEDAADIQFGRANVVAKTFDDLYDYMNGVNNETRT